MENIKGISALGDAETLTIASGGVIFNPAGQVLLVKSSDSGLWQFPGGSITPNESLKAAAQREIKEETGVVVDFETQTPHIYTFEQNKTRLVLVHFVSVLDFNPEIQIQSAEISKAEWFSVSGLPSELCPNILPILEEVRKNS